MMTTSQEIRRRRTRNWLLWLGLGTPLLLGFLTLLVLGFLVLWQAQWQKDTSRKLQKFQARVQYNWQFAPTGKQRSAEPTPLSTLGKALFGDEAFQSIAAIDLPPGKACPEQLWQRVSQCRQLQSLDAVGAGLDDQKLAWLTPLTQLQSLTLSDNPITDTGVQHLGCLTQLRTLRLAGTQIGTDGLETLRSLPLLEGLDLERTPIEVTDLALLAEFPALRELYLDDLPFTDTAVEPLSQLTSLRFLSLSGTDLSPTGFQTLRSQLPKTTIRGD